MRATLLAFAFLASSAGPAAASDPADEPPSVQTVADTYRSAHPQMTAAEAQKAADDAPVRKSLFSPLTEDGGRTFGGAWFDPPSGVLHINATTPTAVARAVTLGRAKGLNVQGRIAPRSFAQLERQAAALRSEAGLLGAAAKGRVGIDVRSNKVVVAVSARQRPGLLAAAEVAGVKLIADPNEPVEADVCAGRDVCDGSIAAGAMLWSTTAGNFKCSIGFTAEDPFTNERFVYTAGHCSNGIGVTWGTGAEPIGPLIASLDAGDIDASLIRVANPLYTGQQGGELYNTSDVNEDIEGLAEIWVGEVVCKAANFQDPAGPRYCGEIGLVSDAAVRGMVRVEQVDACGGDSGGLWYLLVGSAPPQRIAYGIHSRSDAGCRGSQGGDTSWFSALPTVEAGLAPALLVECRPPFGGLC